MKRLLAKTGRFFWSWGFLKFILWTFTLIVLFYIEEDWRGARAWAATKAEWEAKGESFDYNKFIPPPIPDDENIEALPLFKLERGAGGDVYFDSQGALQRAMLPRVELPSRGNWMRGELPNREKIRNAMALDYAAAFPGAIPPADTLAQFNALCPFMADLRLASASRPLCRFNLDYTVFPPYSRTLVPVTNAIRLSQFLTLHAVLALDHQQPDLALEDIKIDYKLLPAAARDPSLVGGLVAIGTNAITQGAIYDGLALHAWDDAQLAELEQTLGRVDFLADYQFAMRSEAAVSTCDIDALKNAPRNLISGLVNGVSDSSTHPWIDVPFLWPHGWWDQDKSQIAPFFFQDLTAVDPQSHRVFPQVDLDLTKRTQQACSRWDANAPWNFWLTLGAPSFGHTAQKFAYGQSWIDEAQIACALERYRLAHGIYPGSLDALTPAYIDELPHDIMSGKPYHYRLQPDGTYLLYSVGWNQADDGGKIVFEKGKPDRIDYTEGDWVWPTEKNFRQD